MITLLRKVIVIVVSILLMVALIPYITSDFGLGMIYISVAAATFLLSKDKKEVLFFVLGFLLLTFAEIWFVSMGVETFNRETLFFGIPLWLPILWGYVFIMIRRGVHALDDFLSSSQET